jgi:hypothetical protein
MRLFLFSASVFYLLGLKLISKIEIQPFFHHKPVSTEAPILTPKKTDIPTLKVKPEDLKKDTLKLSGTKSKQSSAPAKRG